MKVFFLSFALLLAFNFLLLTSAFAELSSQPIYGGGQFFVSKGFVSVDIKVANPQSQSIWLDNLTINDSKYQPDGTINFQINLANTGNTEIKRIDIKDVFPQFVSFISGPGSFDPNTKTLSLEANNLKSNENRTFLVVGRVVSVNQLPMDIDVICMANQVTAIAADSGMSQDNALFCVQKEVGGHQTGQYQSVRPSPEPNGSGTAPPNGGFPVFPPEDLTRTPATGPETLLLFSLLPAGIAGWLLRKYSK